MVHHRIIPIIAVSLWLSLATGPLRSEPYDEAMQALAEGEYRAAYRDLKRLAQQDHAEAQYQLGMLYLFGQGVETDVAQGIGWLKRAAEGGVYLAANELGQIYAAGRGVPRDDQEAARWIELATRLAGEAPGQADDGCE